MSPDFEVSANLRFWPVLEIATFELLAENRPFGIAQRHQFKCNGHSPLVAERRCAICGLYLNNSDEDLNVLNFERFKWGGVRHDDVLYASFDLNLFLAGEIPTPKPEDVAIFRSLITAISAVPAEVTSATLHTHFAKVLKSNKAEREVIIAILGFCGILGTLEHPGYSDAFIYVSERKLPDRRFVDMSYPACWWRGLVGLNRTKLNEYFGHIL